MYLTRRTIAVPGMVRRICRASEEARRACVRVERGGGPLAGPSVGGKLGAPLPPPWPLLSYFPGERQPLLENPPAPFGVCRSSLEVREWWRGGPSPSPRLRKSRRRTSDACGFASWALLCPARTGGRRKCHPGRHNGWRASETLVVHRETGIVAAHHPPHRRSRTLPSPLHHRRLANSSLLRSSKSFRNRMRGRRVPGFPGVRAPTVWTSRCWMGRAMMGGHGDY